jgi:[acyl-carrier-protein] S-malonyltransferase
MGLALAERSPAAAALLDLVGELTGHDARQVLSRGGPALERTDVLQPLLVAVALGAHQAALDAGLRPDLVAGHSLGEVAAWSAAGCVDAADAVCLAAERGRLMAEAAVARPGGMAAFGSADEVARALPAGLACGPFGLAAHNAPDEWVLSGAEPALAAALQAAPGRRLRVSGAWHSTLMAPAREPLREAALAVPARRGGVQLLSNVTGATVGAEERIPGLLADALTAPVRFAALLACAARLGATDVVVLGPPKVVRGLVRRNLPGLPVHLVSEPGDAARVAEALST